MHLPCELFTGNKTTVNVVLCLKESWIFLFEGSHPILAQKLADVSICVNTTQTLLRLLYDGQFYYLYTKFVKVFLQMLAHRSGLSITFAARMNPGFGAKNVQLQMFDDCFCLQNDTIPYSKVICCSVEGNRAKFACPQLGEVELVFFSLFEAKQFQQMLINVECARFVGSHVKCVIGIAVAVDPELEALVS